MPMKTTATHLLKTASIIHLLATRLLLCGVWLVSVSVGWAADFAPKWQGGSDVWTHIGSWTQGTFPNNGTPSPTYDVTLDNGSTVTLTQDIAIQKFTLHTGTVTGAFSLTANDLISLEVGTLGGTGTVINANGDLSIAGGTFGTGVTVNNAFGHTATQFLTSGGNQASNPLDAGTVFNNAGTYLAQGSFGSNQGIAGPGTFNNSGVFTRNTGTGLFYVGATFNNNTGTVNANSGTLYFDGASTASTAATWNVGSNGSLVFNKSMTFDAASTLTGSGTIKLGDFGSGTFTVNANYPFTGTTVITTNYTVNLPGDITFNGPVTMLGATLNVPASKNATINNTFVWRGTLGGGGKFTPSATGSVTLGSYTLGTNTEFNNPADKTLSQLLDPSGNQATGALNAGAVFNNAGTYLAQAAFGSIQGLSGPGIFNNSGTFTRNANGGDFYVTAPFTNTGTVNANSGLLSFQGSVTSTGGTFSVASGAELRFANTSTFDATSSITGAGTAHFQGGTQTINGAYTVSGLTFLEAGNVSFANGANLALLTMTGGTLTIPTTMICNVSGLLSAGNGSTINGGGTINANGGINYTGGLNLSGATTLNNPAGQTTTHTTGGIGLGTAGRFNNGGTYLAQRGDADHLIGGSSPALFTNSGNFTRNVGTGRFGVDAPFLNTGTVSATTGTLVLNNFTQTAGTLNLIGGTVTSDGPALTINGGSVTGSGTISCGVGVTGGRISPTGTIAISGDLTLSGASTLEISLRATPVSGLAAGNDLITKSTGSGFTRNGTLTVRLPTAFRPANGDSFTVFTNLAASGTTTGQFSNVGTGGAPSGRINAFAADGTTVVGTFAINTGTASVVLTDFIPFNHPPVIAADNAARSVAEGSAITNTGTFSDPDGNATVELSASIGTVTPNNAAGTWSWSHTPADGPLTPTVTITAMDSGSPVQTATASFSLTVTNVPPTLALSGNATVNEGSSYPLGLGAVTDPGADTISSYTINWGDGTTPQTFTGVPSGSKAHTFANGAAAGTARTISVTLVDEDGTFAAAGTKAITVSNVVPTANNQSRTVLEDSAATSFTLTASDPGTTDTKTFAIVSPPSTAEGTLGTLNTSTGVVTFTPAANFNGSTGFTFTATDSDGAVSNVATVSITVTAVNDAPTLNALTSPVALADSAPLQTVSLSGISTGAANETQVLAVTATSSNTAVIPNPTVIYTPSQATGSITYQPLANTVGTAIITVTVTDDGGGTNSVQQSFTVNVTDQHAPTVSHAPVVEEATGPTGATVNLDAATVSDAITASSTVVYSKNGSAFAFGSTLFPLGDTTVTVTATDAAGNVGMVDFVVTVRDTIAPVVAAHGNVTASATSAGGATVSFAAATATDAVTTSPTITYSKGGTVFPFGPTPFPLGSTTVNISATDAAGNTGTGSFTMTVGDTSAPIVDAHETAVMEATGPTGAIVTYAAATATDPIITSATPLVITYSKASGTLFPLGDTTVEITATDSEGNHGFGSFVVTVRDTTAPVVAPIDPLIAEATSPNGATLSFSAATATDAVTASPTITYARNGSVFAFGPTVFPLGNTLVTATATDAAGNSTAVNFTVTVQDTTAPSITVPNNLTVAATSAAGANVSFTVSASDFVDGVVTATPDHASGSLFPVTTGGAPTPVVVTATDAHGNMATKNFTVAVTANPEIAVEEGGVDLPTGVFRGVAGWGDNRFGQSTVPSGLSAVQAVAAGEYYSLALKSDGTVVGWDKSKGQVPSIPIGLNHVQAIAAGAYHALALKDDGSVVVWGDNRFGQAVLPTGLGVAQAIAAGSVHSLALKSDGTVVAWGDNTYGQSTVPTGLTGVVAVAAGGYHSLALKSNGTVVAWGSNGGGVNAVPGGLTGVIAIAMGSSHALALKNDGTVVSWGSNAAGQRNLPGGLTGVTAIAAGFDFSIALKNDGTVVAAGANAFGQATPPAGLAGVQAISASGFHALAIVTPSSTIAFGSVKLGNISAAKTVTVRNTGTASLTLGGVTLVGGNASDFVLNTSALPASIASGGQATFSITFTPTAVGLRSTTLLIANDDADENPYSITLTGKGNTAPTLNLPTSPLIVEATSASGAVVTFGVSATDAEDNPEPIATATPPSGSTFAVGATASQDTTVNVTTTDADGATTTGSFIVRVADTTGPAITILGTNPTSVIPGTSYSDAGATASDLVSGTRTVTTSGHVDTGRPGNYILTYSAVDAVGNRSTARRTVTVLAGGAAEPSYAPLIAGSGIFATAVQPDGKTVIGGLFTAINGTPRGNIARLNVDGSLDATFAPSVNGLVNALAVQPDGKIVIGGAFTTVAGTTRNSVARVDGSGLLDTAFNPNVAGVVNCMAVQPDGKIIIGGAFNTVGVTARNNIARLAAIDGLADTFNPNTNGSVATVALQADAKVLLGGAFTMVGGDTHNHIARTTSAGVIEKAFTLSADLAVSVICVQADAKFLIGGDFTVLKATPTATTSITRLHLARINNTTVDTTFGAQTDGSVVSIALQTDAVILFAGDFTAAVGTTGPLTTRNRIARVDAAGNLDAGFNPNANAFVTTLGLQADGRVIAGGSFTTMSGNASAHLARLINNGATQSLTVPDASRVIWMRGGSSPETLAVTFEVSIDNGVTWKLLPAPARIPGGWRLNNPGLIARVDSLLRARARTFSGIGDGSAGLVETIAPFRITAATAVTGLASAIESDKATLAGSVNAHGTETATITFEYGFDTNYGSSTPAAPTTATGTANVAVSKALTNLEPNATYHFRVKATTASGVAYGDDVTFTTLLEGGVVSFGTATSTINSRTATAQPNSFPITLLRRAGSAETDVGISASQPATVPTGTIKYVYGTHYRFATEVSSGNAVVHFKHGQASATVIVQLLTPATTAKGAFVLGLIGSTGEVTFETPTSTTVTVLNDITAPTVVVTLPSSITSSITVTGTVNEDIALASITARLNGVSKTFAIDPMTSFTAGVNVPFSLTGLAPENGANSIVVEATVTSGNTRVTTKAFNFAMNATTFSGNYFALLEPVGPPSPQNSGMISLTLANNGTFSGKVAFPEVSIPFTGSITRAGVARFDPPLTTTLDLIDETDFDRYLGTLAFTLDLAGANGLRGSITDLPVGGSVIATFGALTGSQAPIPADVLNQPSGAAFNKGVYTIALTPQAQTPPLATSTYPQGVGAATLTVTGTGVTVVGVLADGTAFTSASDYRSDRTTPLFVSLYQARGFVSGQLNYANLTNSDIAGTNIEWQRPSLPAASFYRPGWPTGITIDAVGTKYDGGSGDLKHKTLDFGQGTANTSQGNASLLFTSTLLGSPIVKALSIAPTNAAVSLIPLSNPGYTFTFDITKGQFSGNLIRLTSTDRFGGVLLNKGINKGGFGFILSRSASNPLLDGQSGSVFLDPAGP